MKVKNTKNLNGKVNITPDVEENEELIGKDAVERIKRLRKNGAKNVDLSVYKIDIK